MEKEDTEKRMVEDSYCGCNCTCCSDGDCHLHCIGNNCGFRDFSVGMNKKTGVSCCGCLCHICQVEKEHSYCLQHGKCSLKRVSLRKMVLKKKKTNTTKSQTHKTGKLTFPGFSQCTPILLSDSMYQ